VNDQELPKQDRRKINELLRGIVKSHAQNVRPFDLE
jgi:hypothetical protein